MVCETCKTFCQICKKETKCELVEKINNYKMFLCAECEVIFSDPMKSTDSLYYRKLPCYMLRQHVKNTLTWEQKEFFKDVSSDSQKSVLDIGCGDGFFLYGAKKKGFEVYGVDFDILAVERAKREFKLDNITCDSLENFLTNTNKVWDCITLFHIIEHIENPVMVLRLIKAHLKNGGVICVIVPNRDRIMKDAWKELDSPPHHFTRYSVNSIVKMLSLSGFDVVRVKLGPVYFGDLIWGKIRFGVANKLVEKFTVSYERKQQHFVFFAKCLVYLRSFFSKWINILGDPLLKLFKTQGSMIYIIGIKTSQARYN